MSTGPDSPWLSGNGPEADLVISSRVRLARNLSGEPFRGRNSPSDRSRIVRQLETAAEDLPALSQGTWYRVDGMPRLSRLWLHEQQLASRELAGLMPATRVTSGAAVVAAGATAVLCNEEDHLRIQALSSGFALPAAHHDAGSLDTDLGHRISFAFHPDFGYLTSCPTNVGTGLRASVLIHLPALVLTREIGKVLQGLAQVGLTHRGLWGEGSEVQGNLFQLSNQTTLGRSEADLLEHLGRLVGEIVGHERRARGVLALDAPAALEDRVWRAWGILHHARELGFEETLNLLSGVRLGIGMGILPNVGWQTINRLLVDAQDAHVARAAETGLDDEALPAHRATMIRRTLAEEVRG